MTKEKKKEIEDELKNYHIISADIQRLDAELVKIQAKLEDAYTPSNMAVNPELARVQKTELDSQVERIVVIRLENIKRDIKDTETQLFIKRDEKKKAELWVEAARLTGTEEEYVRLRYWENNKAELLPKLSRILNYQPTQLERIRDALLEKLRAPYEVLYRK
jgi:hypothetical protein